MPRTRDALIRILADADPDYDRIAKRLGSSALPQLMALVLSPQETALVASKAVEVASRIQGRRSAVRGADIVRAALAHTAPQVRCAAASATVNLAPFPLEGPDMEARTADLYMPSVSVSASAAKDVADAQTCLQVLKVLLDDDHPSVQKCALRAAEVIRPRLLTERISALADSDKAERRLAIQAKKTLDAIGNNP